MPLLKPREGENDGGYAVADFRAVRPDLGTMDDLEALAGHLRERGISLVLDLVLNHVAAEHEWALRARAGDPRYRAYFHVFGAREQPDAFDTHPAGGVPGLRARQLHWVEELAAGCGPRSTATVGPRLVEPGRFSASSSTSSCTSPTGASRCCGWTRSPSSGSGSAPTARTSRRCTT
jgi:hypothetical protein